MDKRPKRKYSRRKRIQLDEDKEEQSPEKDQAASSSTGQSSRPEGSGRLHQVAATVSATTTETDKDETNKQPPLGSPARTGGASPEPNCAICLGKLENKSFTDSCFHQFCYVCLLEWSKVKAECPLCKQTFKSIIHNVRSYEDYDQYHIPRPEDRDPLGDLFSNIGRRFRYRTTVTDHRYYGSQSLEDLQRQLQERMEHHSYQRPTRRHYPVSNHRAWRTLRQAASSSFRRGIYQNGLKAKEQTSTRRRMRATDPDFFRDNDACTHRLVPWLNRELNAVLEGREDRVAYVLDLIMGLIKRYNINSEEFYQHVYPFIGRHTRHFMHEFLMYAKSPYHMAAYDQHVVYEPTSEYVDNGSDNETFHHSDGNESDVVIVSPSGPAQNDQMPTPTGASAPLRIQPMETNLLPWESSIISMAQPNYSYFNPVIPSYSSVMSTGQSRTLTCGGSMASRSGWDSPISGPSWTIGGSSSFNDANEVDVVGIHPISTHSSATATATLSSNSGIQPLDLSNTTTLNLGNDRVSSEDSNIYRSFLDSLNLTTATANSSQASNSDRPVEATSNINPVVCTDSDSDSDAVMIVDYEKPWLERSPIHLSTDNSSDCDILITGTSNMAPDTRVKKHKKRKERKSEAESRVCLSEIVSVEEHDRKRKHRSRSRSLPRQYRKRRITDTPEDDRSRSRSPLLLRLNIPQYKDKFSKHYRKEKEKTKHRSDRKHRDSHRSDSHSSSRSKYWNRSLSSSSSDGEHVSFRSHKHKSRSGGTEIMEYFKKSVKRKKTKKSKHRSRSPSNLAELYHHKKKKHRDRFGSKDSDKKRRHKHRHNKNENDKNPDQFCASLDTFLPLTTARAMPERFGIQNAVGQTDSNKAPSSRSKNISLSKQLSTTPIRSRLEQHKIKEAQTEGIEIAQSSIDKNILGTSDNIEFVEMLPSQTGLVDKELESLTQLFPDFTEKSDAFESLKLSFKKHPHGHKKISKSNTNQLDSTSHINSDDNLLTCVVDSSGERRVTVGETISSPLNLGIDETDIQLNNVTSCTDLETDQPSPTISQVSVSNLKVSIPSTVLEIQQSDEELVDVDGQSEDSYVDVLKISEPEFPLGLAIPSYENSHPSVDLLDSAHNTGNKSTDNKNVHSISDSTTDVTVTVDDGTHLDVDGLSDSGSDTIQFGGVELLPNKEQDVEKEIDVTGVSDSETVTYLSETNVADNDSGSEIDVLAIPSEDIIIEPDNFLTIRSEPRISRDSATRQSKTLCLESDSEGMDLDYQYENAEEIDIEPKLSKGVTKSREDGESSNKLQKTKIEKSVGNQNKAIFADDEPSKSQSISTPVESDSNASLNKNINDDNDEKLKDSDVDLEAHAYDSETDNASLNTNLNDDGDEEASDSDVSHKEQDSGSETEIDSESNFHKSEPDSE